MCIEDISPDILPETAADRYISEINAAGTLLVVTAAPFSSTATMTYYIKNDRKWVFHTSVSAFIGKGGISPVKKEGDMLTPAGCFDIPYAFGNLPDPGCRLSYRNVTPDDYYVDDPASLSYNTWVSTRRDNKIKNFISAEHLCEIRPEYDYAAMIDHNRECIPGNGSAVFLHCTGTKQFTAGCVAVHTDDMRMILTTMIPPVKIIICAI